ncbi:MAG: hypothetical protein GY909_10670 [Oligoflexia bacterium]|nr:hypothetical protein [Oligoflexia bacterium]
MQDIPYNMNYDYGDLLREVPEDAESLRQGIEFLQDKIKESIGKKEKLKLYSQLGFYQRLLGSYQESLQSFDEATHLVNELNENNYLDSQLDAIEIRRSVTLLWMGKISQAQSSLTKLQEKHEAMKDSKYLDFIYQHYGKLKFEQKQFKTALDLFLKALEIRIVKGNIELISSTELAIAKTRENL